jgi:hypothetical protein
MHVKPLNLYAMVSDDPDSHIFGKPRTCFGYGDRQGEMPGASAGTAKGLQNLCLLLTVDVGLTSISRHRVTTETL